MSIPSLENLHFEYKYTHQKTNAFSKSRKITSQKSKHSKKSLKSLKSLGGFVEFDFDSSNMIDMVNNYAETIE